MLLVEHSSIVETQSSSTQVKDMCVFFSICISRELDLMPLQIAYHGGNARGRMLKFLCRVGYPREPLRTVRHRSDHASRPGLEGTHCPPSPFPRRRSQHQQPRPAGLPPNGAREKILPWGGLGGRRVLLPLPCGLFVGLYYSFHQTQNFSVTELR